MRLLFVLMLLTAGCASMEAVENNYATMVNKTDGVNEQEAKIIAQKEILKAVEKRDYRITAPSIKSTLQAKQFPDYWFVVFGHNWFSPISMDPLAKTYTDLREGQFLVVIAKLDGQIIFSGEWYPKRMNDFSWVFNLDQYEHNNPLKLPPGRRATVAFEEGNKY